ncbi:MAG: hypothetical protein IAI48_06375 [Candidatus Eremiobacteraeota bacterium]|nr:hypothetical protein [Candidatus Eremiobacteraeota bacterium]
MQAAPPPPPAIACRHFTRNPMCRPLPANPQVSPYSAAWAAQQAQPGRPPAFASFGSSTAPQPGDRSDGSFPLYADAGPGNSIVHVVRCEGVSYSAFICEKNHVAGIRVRIPRGAFPQGNADHHLSIEDDAAKTEFDFWGASAPSDDPESPLVALTGGACPYDGDGTDCSGSTATGIATSLGAIDPHALVRAEASPHGTLPYAIATSALCASPTWVYPATFSDGSNTDKTPACRDGLGANGRPPEGVRYFLDVSDAEVDATANAPYVKALLRTLDREHFGGTLTDTNWSGAPGLAFGFLRGDDWSALAREAGVSAAGGLPMTTNGIDLAKKLRFCTNGTC